MSFRSECETRALRCVEQLLEKGITADQLIQSAEVLSNSRYNDVIEERNIGDLCGYPLCDSSLGPIPKQKYHIDVVKKQVFDLTERKKFCSDACYKCSQYFAAQLSPSPLWSRTKPINIEKIKLLSLLPVSKTSVSTAQSSQSDLTDTTDSSLSTTHSSKSLPETSSITSSLQSTTLSHSEGSASVTPPSSGTLTSQLQSIKERQVPQTRSSLNASVIDPDTVTPSLQPPKLSQVGKLRSAISTWVSGQFHRGEEENRPLHEISHGSCVKDDETQSPDESHDKDSVKSSELHDGDIQQEIFLPPVDSVNINRLQRTLFNSQFRKHISRVCSTLEISFYEVLPKVNSTTSRFRLNRHCITFRMAEWSIISVLVIIISCGEIIDPLSNSHVKQWLEEIKGTPEDFKLMLSSFHD